MSGPPTPAAGAAPLVRPAVQRWLDRWASRVIIAVLIVADLLVTPAAVDAGANLRSPDGRSLVALAVFCVAVWWRRRRPLAAVGLVIVGYALTGDPATAAPASGIPALVSVYSMGAWAERRRVAAALAIALALLLAAATSEGAGPFAALVAPLGLVAVPFLVGVASRNRRSYLEAVEQRLADSDAARDALAREAVVAERARIARELHDVVAHHVSLIGVQAGAARATIDTAPDLAKESLRGVESSARSAVEEMRHLLGALSPAEAGAGAERHPTPGLGDLDALLTSFRDAGLVVDARVRLAGPLPATLDLHAHRIVEEALTNVVRHSRASTARLLVAREAGRLVLEVVDPGPARDLPRTPGTGRGLIGMRERVQLCGGNLDTGPEGAGFRVRAVLPLPAAVVGAARPDGLDR